MIKIIRTLFLLALGAGSVFAGPQGQSVDQIAFYFGEVQLLSPDGNTAFAKTVSLVKRSILPAQGKIVEAIIQPGRKPGDPAREIITTMTRIDSSSVFNAQDEGRTFLGTLTFDGSEWSWDTWQYEILLNDGSRIRGNGRLDASGIHTDKHLVNPQGAISVRIKEALSQISEQEYQERRRDLLGR